MNTRGVFYMFGQDIVVEMCAKLDIDLVTRVHQVPHLDDPKPMLWDSRSSRTDMSPSPAER